MNGKITRAKLQPKPPPCATILDFDCSNHVFRISASLYFSAVECCSCSLHIQFLISFRFFRTTIQLFISSTLYGVMSLPIGGRNSSISSRITVLYFFYLFIPTALGFISGLTTETVTEPCLVSIQLTASC